MNSVHIIEDHDEALGVWRRARIRDLDLLHFDAHMDFEVHPARPPAVLLDEAKSVTEFKRGLEYTLAFLRYEKDLNKQTNIGNYIYPAMREGIVRDFYWVVPGGPKEFQKSKKLIRNMLAQACRAAGGSGAVRERQDGGLSVSCLGREFIALRLEHLPDFRRPVLLDIDVDFLVVASFAACDNTKNIGCRRPWIRPRDFVGILREKIKKPRMTTVAYSTRGGYTPMKYRVFGDEIAFCLAPGGFKNRLERSRRAAACFASFLESGSAADYRRAAALDPAYREADNSYGPLYLAAGKISRAQEEFFRIHRVDQKNSGILAGLGQVALRRRRYQAARRYFLSARRHFDRTSVSSRSGFKEEVLLGWARAEFALKNFKKAKVILEDFLKIQALEPEVYYLLGRVAEDEKCLVRALRLYQDAIRLGHQGLEPLSRIAGLCFSVGDNRVDVVKYIREKARVYEKNLACEARLAQREKGKKRSAWQKRIQAARKKLQRIQEIVK